MLTVQQKLRTARERLVALPAKKHAWRRPLPLAVLSLAILLLLAVVLGLRFSGASATDLAPGSDPQWGSAQRLSFPILILATGELDPSQKVEILNNVQEQSRVVQIIDEGKTVQKDEVLARLADDKIREKIEQETLQVEQALAAQVAAQEQLAVAQSAAVSDARSGELKVELARMELAKWQNGTDKLKIEELKLDQEKAQRKLTRAVRDVEQSTQLHAEKFISLSELEDDQLTQIEAENELATANLEREIYEKYTRVNEQRKYASEVEEAEAALQRDNRKNASDIAEKQADVRNKTQALKIRQDRLAQLNSQLEATVIKAPRDGIIVYGTSVGRRWWDENPLREGREVRFNELLFIMPDMRQMSANLRVHEALVPRVQVGQTVNITIDARPGQVVQGKVNQISVMAEASNFFSDVREYIVKVELPPGFDDSLKPGMRCSGEIHTDQVTDALAVPVQAISADADEHFCYVADRGAVRKQAVKIGRSSQTLTEILEGLSDSDRVLLRKPRPGEVRP